MTTPQIQAGLRRRRSAAPLKPDPYPLNRRHLNPSPPPKDRRTHCSPCPAARRRALPRVCAEEERRPHGSAAETPAEPLRWKRLRRRRSAAPLKQVLLDLELDALRMSPPTKIGGPIEAGAR